MDGTERSRPFAFRSSADDLARWRSRSGTTIRRLAPQERIALAALVREEARLRRLAAFTRLGDVVLALGWPLELQQEPGAAFAATDDQSGTVTAIGCYHQVERGVAELAFLIDEEEEGIAARLLREAAEDARANGIRTFRVQVPLENQRAFEALRSCGLPMTCQPLGGTATVTLSIGGRAADSA